MFLCLTFFSFLFFYFLRISFWEDIGWRAMVFLPLGAFFCLGASVGIFYLLEQNKKVLFLCLLPILAAFVCFSELKMAVILGILGGVIFLSRSLIKLNKEKSLRLKFAPSAILRNSFPCFVAALSLFASLMFYWSPLAQKIGEEAVVPRPLFDAIAKPMLGYVSNLSGQAVNQALPVGVQMPSVVPQMDDLYNSVNMQVSILSAPYKKFIPLGAAVSFFFAVKFFSLFLIWPVVFFSWLAFKLLLVLGIVNIKKIETEKEAVEI